MAAALSAPAAFAPSHGRWSEALRRLSLGSAFDAWYSKLATMSSTSDFFFLLHWMLNKCQQCRCDARWDRTPKEIYGDIQFYLADSTLLSEEASSGHVQSFHISQDFYLYEYHCLGRILSNFNIHPLGHMAHFFCVKLGLISRLI